MHVDIMDRNCCPRSLVAYAAEEVAKAYKFASQDAFSFVRNIDYHPINIEGLSTEYEIFSDRKIKQFDEKEKDRFFITLNRFLINRSHVMKVMLNHLAKMVVNFTSTEEVNEEKLKEIRAKYVASNKAQDELETIGIKLNLENNTEKLLSQIQQERTRAKLMNLFVNQSYLKYGDTVEGVHLDLGNFPIRTKTVESLNNTATSTCAGIVANDIYAKVGNDTALEKNSSLNNVASVVDNAEEGIICNKNNEDKMKQYFQDDGVRFEVAAERASDKQDTNTERDGLLLYDTRVVETAEDVLTVDVVSKVAFEKDSSLEDEGEGNDINTNNILDIASDTGWTDDEEDDEDNFVLYGMMNYRPD